MIIRLKLFSRNVDYLYKSNANVKFPYKCYEIVKYKYIMVSLDNVKMFKGEIINKIKVREYYIEIKVGGSVSCG